MLLSTNSSTSSVHSPTSSYTIDPRASLSNSTPATSPSDSTYIKTEDSISDPMPLPAIHHLPDAQAAQLDRTQHSAAMLCDLQCQSSLDPNSSLPSPPSTFPAWWWTRITLCIIITTLHLSVMTTYKTLLLTFWTLSPARMTARLSTLRPLTASSTLTRRPRRPSTFPLPQQPTTIFLSQVLQPTLHPFLALTLAQQLLLATGLVSLGSSALALTHGQRLPSVTTVGKSLVAPVRRRSSGSLEEDDLDLEGEGFEPEHGGGGRAGDTGRGEAGGVGGSSSRSLASVASGSGAQGQRYDHVSTE